MLFGQERKIGNDLVNLGRGTGGINLVERREGSGVSGSAGGFFFLLSLFPSFLIFFSF